MSQALKEFLTKSKDHLHTNAIDHTMVKKWGNVEVIRHLCNVNGEVGVCRGF